MAAIKARHLTKKYGDTVAVEGVSMSIPEGKVYGFLGPNGAGKTTTMRLLTSLIEATSGTASVAGVDVQNRDELRKKIGFLPEKPPLYEEATAYEQLDYVAGLRDLPDREARERVEEMFDALDLPPEDASKRISEYSKGMKQKVAFVQAVLHRPEVVFLDEPTSGLDPRSARTLREMIRGLAGDDSTVFLSTHILPVVEEVADVVGILYEGRIVAEDSPGNLTEKRESGGERTLEDAFLDVTDTDPAETSESGG
ncbi:MAG: ABC transporter ATP-binding protein [Halobacteria archaeon]